MSFEEEFDRRIREKSEELKYPFDEKNWEKASMMLDAERKGAAGGFQRFLLPVAAVILLSVGGIVLVEFNEPMEQIAVTTPKIGTGDSQANSSLAKAKTLTNESGISGKPEKGRVNEATPSSELMTQKAKSRSPLAYEPAPNKAVVNAVVSEPVAVNEKLVGKSSVSITRRTSAAPNVTGNAPMVSNENVNSSGSAAALETTFNEGKVTVSEEQFEAAGTDETVRPEHLAMVQQFLPPVAESQELRATTQINPGDDYFVRSHRKFHYLNVEGGGAYMPGWNTESGKDAKGLNWVVSANYGIYLSKKLSLGAGVQAYNITNIKKPFYTAKATTYAFSAIQTETVLTASSLYYIAIPIRFNYHLNAMNSLGIGISAGYLLGSRNKIDYKVNDEFGTLPAPSETNTGYYNVFSPYNMMLTASYATAVGRRFSVNGEIFYGITDIIINKNNDKKDAELPAGIRISLRYSIFDK